MRLASFLFLRGRCLLRFRQSVRAGAFPVCLVSQARAIVKIFRSARSFSMIFAARCKWLASNGLQNEPFWLAERLVLNGETGCFILQNGLFRNRMRRPLSASSFVCKHYLLSCPIRLPPCCRRILFVGDGSLTSCIEPFAEDCGCSSIICKFGFCCATCCFWICRIPVLAILRLGMFQIETSFAVEGIVDLPESHAFLSFDRRIACCFMGNYTMNFNLLT